MAQTRLTQTDTAAMPNPETDVLIVGAGIFGTLDQSKLGLKN